MNSFWWDNWTEKGALANIPPRRNGSTKDKVKEFFSEEDWNVQTIESFLSEDMVQHIENISCGYQDAPYFIYWDATPDRQYSNSSVWQLVRAHKQSDWLSNMLWHNNLPFKISFLSWRLIRGKLPFDDTINRFGKHLISRCSCCSAPERESIHHVFICSEAAQTLWKFFGHPLGIKHQLWPIKGLLSWWWQTRTKNKVHKFLIQIVPVVICWEVWRNRCACRYGNQKKFYKSRMKNQIYWIIRATLNKAFPKCQLTMPWVELC